MPDDLPLDTADLLFWVTELRAGRADAAEPQFRKIIARVEQMARHMFRRFPRVGRYVDVDDVVQNTLIRLLRTMQEVRPESTRQFYALTTELIRRELLDLAKHYYGPRGEGTNRAAVAVGEAIGEHTPAAPEPTADLERLAAFHAAVERLPVEQREVIGLTYYHGWQQDAIAELFQVNVRTVQRWYQDAKASLQAELPSA
ncbi:MAG: sigma-70 family RNA polymerase sigma factor [Gemmataceae bacterium]